MSWLDAAWPARAFAAADNTDGDTDPIDIEITIPPEHELFWGSVASDHADLRVTLADGRTAVDAFTVASWDVATRTAVIRVHGVTPVVAVYGVWVYWGAEDAEDTADTFTPTGAELAGVVAVGGPTARVVRAAPERPGATAPRAVVSKGSGEAVRVWWDFRSLLSALDVPLEGSRCWEEIERVPLIQALDANGDPVDAMIDTTQTLVDEGWVSTWCQGGTQGEDYTLVVRIRTTQETVIEARAALRVRDVEA